MNRILNRTRMHSTLRTVAFVLSLTLLGVHTAEGQSAKMNFFITSQGSGDGANLGGLAGADQICEDLAYAQGAGGLGWKAYLSAKAADGHAAVNARDRIGDGPWFNYNGELIANDVDELHSDEANLTKETILTEQGTVVNGRGDDPNQHDILTGSTLDGRVFPAAEHTVCDNWTSNGEGSTRVGHHDRQGGGENPTSWNSAHGSRGCSQANLEATGGFGLFYCFAPGS